MSEHDIREVKSIWASKTFWYNVAMGLLTIGVEVAPLLDLITNPDVQNLVQTALLVATVIGNVILRFVTFEPVRL